MSRIAEKNPTEKTNLSMSQVVNNLISFDPNYNIPLHGHTGPVWSVQATSDDAFIFSGSEDKTILIWSADTQMVKGKLEGHTSTVNALEVTKDDKFLISGAWDNKIKIWDWENQELVGELVGHTGGVYCFILNKEGDKLISGSGDGTAKIWNIAQRTIHASLDCSGNSVFCMALTSDEKVLITGGWGGQLRIWNYLTNTLEATHDGESGVIQSMAITPDKKYLVFGTRTNVVRVLDFPSRTLYFEYKQHNNWVRNIVTTNDSMFFISASADKTIRLVNIIEKTEEFNFEGNDGYVFGLCLSKDGTILYSGASDKIVRVRNIGICSDVKVLKGHLKCIMSIAISADNKYIVSGSEDKTVKKWEIATNSQVLSLDYHTETVWGVTITTDLKYIISASGDLRVIISDYNNGEQVSELKGHSNPIFCIAVSNNCEYTASGAQDKMVILWSLISFENLKIFEGHTDTVFSVKFTEDNEKLVSGAADYTVRIWSVKQLIQINKLNTKSGMIESVALTKDGKYMGIGDRKNQVHLWNWEDFSLIKSFKTHTQWVKCVTFSNDGKFLASSCNDKTIRIWNVFERYQEMIFYGHTSTIRSIMYSNNGNFLVSGSEDLTVRVWSLNDSRIMKIADYCGKFDHFLYQMTICSKKKPAERYQNYSYSPLRINFLHIYCYLDQAEQLQIGLNSDIQIKLDANGNSPLFYALERHSQSCIDIFLEYLIKNAKNQANFLDYCYIIRNDFILLLKNRSNSLYKFLQCVLITQTDSNIPRFGIPKRDLPIFKISNTTKIEFDDFIAQETEKNKKYEQELTFKIFPFPIDCAIGSENSLTMMKNVFYNKNTLIYQTDSIQALINLRWKRLKSFLLIETIFHWLAILSILILLSNNKATNSMSVIYFICNFSLLALYSLKASILGIFKPEGLENDLNLGLSLSIIICYFIDINHQQQGLLYLIIICSMIRGILGLEIFDSIRIYVNTIRTIFIDMAYYFILLVIPIFICLIAPNNCKETNENWNFFISNKDFFYLGTFFTIFVMILLNLAINRAYCKEYNDKNINLLLINQQKLKKIIEYESVMIWNRKQGKNCYLQICNEVYIDTSSSEVELIVKKLEKIVEENTNHNTIIFDEVIKRIQAIESNTKK